MIKNILYSLLLHSTFAFLIYFNFRHIVQETIELKDGLTVGVVSLQDITKPAKITTPSQITDAPKTTPISKAETKKKNVAAPKTTAKKKIITAPKKQEQPLAKNNKAAQLPLAKPMLESKAQFKKTEEEKTKEVAKNKDENEIKTKDETQEIKAEKLEEVAQKTDDETAKNITNDEENKSIETKSEAEEQAEEGRATGLEALNAENISDVADLENLQLSAREKFNIQSQLRACYKRATINVAKSNYTALVKVVILPDGTIDFDAEKIIDSKRYNAKDQNYKNRMDTVLQTFELCSPLRNMPSDKYEIWREFTIEFGD